MLYVKSNQRLWSEIHSLVCLLTHSTFTECPLCNKTSLERCLGRYNDEYDAKWEDGTTAVTEDKKMGWAHSEEGLTSYGGQMRLPGGRGLWALCLEGWGGCECDTVWKGGGRTAGFPWGGEQASKGKTGQGRYLPLRQKCVMLGTHKNGHRQIYKSQVH